MDICKATIAYSWQCSLSRLVCGLNKARSEDARKKIERRLVAAWVTTIHLSSGNKYDTNELHLTLSTGRGEGRVSVEIDENLTIDTLEEGIGMGQMVPAGSDSTESATTPSSSSSSVMFSWPNSSSTSSLPEDGIGRMKTFSTVLSITLSTAAVDCEARVLSGETRLGLKVDWEDGKDEAGIECSLSGLAGPDARRLLHRLRLAVEEISTANPQCRVVDLHLFTTLDWEQIELWNGPGVPATHGNLDALLHDVARSKGECVAIDAWDGSLTYAELDRYATESSIKLISLGIGRGDLVPLCCEKTVWFPVAALAVLKTGAAYVPLDPSTSDAHLLEGVRRVNSHLVVGSAALRERLQRLGLNVMCVSQSTRFENEESWPQWNAIQAERSDSDPMVVMFTSGSTGRPKGVVLQHEAIVTSAIEHGKRLHFGMSTRALQFAAHTFDVSVLEIFTTLLFGGCVCIPSDDDRVNRLASYIDKMRINLSFLTPTVASLLNPDEVPSLTTLIIGGETVTHSNLKSWGHRNLHLVYGPSECTVLCQIHPFATAESNPASLGRPCGGRTYIVDPHDHTKLLPIGAVGELMVEGPIVGQGYLNDQERTAMSFKPAPSWKAEGRSVDSTLTGTVYLSGDLVRYASDGSVLFVARKDTQVKVHGQRLEVEEVEGHLLDHPLVTACVALYPSRGVFARRLVLVYCSISGNRVLHNGVGQKGAIAIDEEPLCDGSTLQQFLLERMPQRLIPSIWVPLHRVPLTASGKIDRKSVQLWAEALERAPVSFVSASASRMPGDSPWSPVEATFRSYWSQVLVIPSEAISLGSSFLRLGGDSIAAMQLVSLARQNGIAVTVKQILEAKTLQDLARIAMQQRASPISQGPRNELLDVPLPLSPMQELHFRLRPDGGHHHNMGFLLRCSKPLDATTLRRSVDELVQRHSMLRARFVQLGSQWFQKIVADVQASWRYTLHEVDSLDNISAVVESTSQLFDIANGPLLAVELVSSQTSRTQMLYIHAHHLIGDLVSWRILIQELNSLLDGEILPMHLSTSFQEWTLAQLKQLVTLQAEDEVYTGPCIPFFDGYQYWGVHGEHNQYGDVVQLAWEVDEDITSQLMGPVNDALGTEPIDLLLGCFAHAFLKVLGDRDSLTIFNEGHGRETWEGCQLDITQTVGWFTTMYPFHFDRPNGIFGQINQARYIRTTSPLNGRPYFAATHTKTAPIRPPFKDHWQPEVVFNFHGRYRELEREDRHLQATAWGKYDATFDGPTLPRYGLLEIETAVDRGCLRAFVRYNRHMQEAKARVEMVSDLWRDTLQHLRRHLEGTTLRLTRADFPHLSLDEASFTALLDALKGFNVALSRNGDIQALYRCTPVQEGMLVAQQRDPNLYRVSVLWEFSRAGKGVEPQLLIDAWKHVVSRHDILRALACQCLTENPFLVHVVLKSTEPVVEVIEGAPGVPLMEDPFLPHRPRHKITIFSEATVTHVRLEVCHSLIDGTSLGVIAAEMSSYLGRVLRVDVPANPETPVAPQFADYATTQSSLSIPDVTVAYWKDILQEMEPTILPGSKEAPSESTQPLSTVLGSWPKKTLDFVAAELGITSPTLFHLVWGIVLFWYTGNEHPCFGWVLSDRARLVDGVAQALVGPAIYTTVDTLHVRSDMTVVEAAQMCQEAHLAALPHVGAPLRAIQRWAGVQDATLFNTILTVEQHREAAPGDITIRRVRLDELTEYDVVIQVDVFSSYARVSMTSRQGFLSPEDHARLGDAFETVLNSLLGDARQQIGDISRCRAEDIQQIRKWNKHCPEQVAHSVQDLISHAAMQSPDATSVDAWDGQLTYQQLEDLSDRMAHHLAAAGVGQEDLVAICVDKSRWAVVALLAILKAGAGYCPLDPNYPSARIQEIVDTCGPKAILTAASTASLIPMRSLRIEDLLGSPCEISLPTVSPSNVFCVIYTSGSTGKPKGVVLEHGNITTAAREHGRIIGFGPQTRSFQFSTYTFDVSIMEIFTTLIFGGTVCIPSETDRISNLGAAMSGLHVNWSFLTPTVASLVEPDEIPTLSSLVLGGEPVPRQLVEMWSGRVDLHMVYGPSECTTLAQMHAHVRPDTPPTSLGRPVGGSTWIVEAGSPDKLAPVGETGELLICGHIVGRGYLNDPQRTADAFLRKPLWLQHFPEHQHLQRFYRTGDLVRYDEAGNVHYVARRDTQVKLRGQRIELRDVEYHLARAGLGPHLAVEIVHIGKARRATLAAFVEVGCDANIMEDEDNSILVPDDGQRAEFARAKAQLARDLPSYMVPTLIVPIRRLPQTLSGKTDRKHLRLLASRLQPQQLAGLREANVTIKMTKEEVILQDCFASVLDLSPTIIGPDCHFFESGGDSFSAIKLVGLAAKKGLRISAQEIFTRPILSSMAVRARPIGAEKGRDLGPFHFVPTESRGEWLSKAAEQCGEATTAVDDILPCTPFQEALVSLTFQESDAYFAKYRVAIHGNLDRKRWQMCWHTVYQRHAVLRCRFVSIFGRIYQAVIRDWSPAWNAPPKGENGQMLGWESSALHFDDESTFIWSIHHALIDGWSLELVLSEVIQLYENSNPPPTPPSAAFQDFIRYLDTSFDVSAAESFWRESLSQQTMSSFPLHQGSRSSTDGRSMYQTETCKLSVKPSGISAAATILAALGLTMSCHTGSSSVCFGYVISGRLLPIAGIDHMVGPVLATIPFPVSIDGQQTVHAFIHTLQSRATEAMIHAHIGLSAIRNLGEAPRQACAFQTLLVVQPNKQAPLRSPSDSLVLEVQGGEMIQSYPLTLQLWLDGDETVLEAIFDSAILERNYIRSLMAHFRTTLQRLQEIMIHGNPQTVATVSPFSDRDKLTIRTWQQRALQKPVPTLTVPMRLSQLAKESPETVCVDAWDGQWTRRQLDSLSNIWSQRLQAGGVNPGDLVALLFAKSKWAIVAMLATWKAGAGYLMLDGEQPPERPMEVLRASQCTAIMSSPPLAETAQALARPLQIPVVVMGSSSIVATTAGSSLTTPASMGSTAYTIFTSGSTGIPKGVLVDHMALTTVVQECGMAMEMNSHTRTLQFSSYQWDAHAMEHWATLWYGGTLCVPSDTQRTSALSDFITSFKVNITILTPTVSRLLDQTSIRALHCLVYAGEAVLKEDLVRLRTINPVLRVMNGYGPTEGTICASLNPDLTRTSIANIGCPIGGQHWILDPENPHHLAPVGCVGELALGGRSLARGYLDEEKTRAAFPEHLEWMRAFSDCFGANTSRRVYLTGDLVRYTSNGSLEFVGRKDNQMKVHGVRVEPGEIEQQILQALAREHTSRTSVAVDLVDMESGPCVVAYLAGLHILKRWRLLWPRLRHRLGQQLPGYMIPRYFIPLAQMPRGPNGKADRSQCRQLLRQLSAQDMSQYQGYEHVPVVRPLKTATELELAGLWRQALSLDAQRSLSPDDSFIALGGDSLSAMKLSLLAHQKAIPLTVPVILKAPRLADMALTISSNSLQASEMDEPNGTDLLSTFLLDGIAREYQLSSSNIEDVYPCTALQEAFYSFSTHRANLYISRHIFLLPPSLDLDRFQRAWQRLSDLNPILRTRIVHIPGKGTYQVLLRKELHEWEAVDGLNNYLSAEPASGAMGAPLTKHALVREEDGRLLFVWTAHHAVYDGWSLPLIFEQVVLLYRDPNASSNSGPNSFKQFISHTVRPPTDPASIEFWRSQLEDAESCDFPVPVKHSHQTCGTEKLGHVVPVDPTRAREAGITPANVIKAAWAFLVGSYCNTRDVLFSMTLSGRDQIAAASASMLGPTICTIPVRLRIEANWDLGCLLETVQRHSLDVLPFQHFGLQNIKRAVPRLSEVFQTQNVLVVQPESSQKAPWYALEELGIRQHMEPSMAEGVPLTMECISIDQEIQLLAHYDPDLIHVTQAQRLLRHFSNVLQTFFRSDLRMPLADITLLGQEDIQTLQEWNGKGSERVDQCLHHLFRQQAQIQPDSPAIDAWDASLTYQELEAASEHLAMELIHLGAGPEVAIPVCFHKSSSAIVAMMAILMAGSCYVALDPSSPPVRLQSIVQQLIPPVILCGPSTEALASSLGYGHMVVDHDTIMLSAPVPPSLALPRTRPDNLAYILFTSGSTGEPKGVMMEHASVATTALDVGRTMYMDHESRVLQFAAFTYDVSIQEIWCTLALGGCICIPSEADRLGDLAATIRSLKVNWAFFTPSFSILLNPEEVPGLRTVALGGEPLTVRSVTQWAGRRVLNGWGPSECCAHSVVNDDVARFQHEPGNIGRPIGERVWIARPDDPHCLAAIGCVGELLVSGPHLARGYLGDQEKTRSSFIEHPAWAKDGDAMADTTWIPRRVYRSGDLGRYNSDGTITIIGRRDTQVKVRGQRVELGEIEYHLSLDSSLSLSLCVFPKQGPFLKQIVALVQPQGLPQNLDSELQPLPDVLMTEPILERLAGKVPSHMMPAALIIMKAIPMLRSGKVDRVRMQNWVENLSVEQASACRVDGSMGYHASPMLDAEDTLAQEVNRLVVDYLPVQDRDVLRGKDLDLARAGIDSISVIGLGRSIHRRYGVNIPIAALSRDGMTVGRVARWIEQAQVGEELDAHSIDFVQEWDLLRSELASRVGIRRRDGANTQSVRSVLVTGATGYLGSEILHQLLMSPELHEVIALVRAPTVASARERVEDIARALGWWQESYADKLIVWRGDLASSRLGLEEHQWARLTAYGGSVDAIIHNGARVHWNAPYPVLRAANVLSTLDLLAAAAHSGSRFCYVSGGVRTFEPQSALPHRLLKALPATNGYAQSKTLSELLVRDYASRMHGSNHYMSIITPGYIIGDADVGVANLDDFLWRYVSACVQLGFFNGSDRANWLFVAGRQGIARQILDVTLHGPPSGKFLTVDDGITVAEFWCVIMETLQRELQPLPRDDFMSILRASVDQGGEKHPMWPVMHFLDVADQHLGLPLPADQVDHTVSSTSVRESIAGTLSYLVRTGFIAGPYGSDSTPALFMRGSRSR